MVWVVLELPSVYQLLTQPTMLKFKFRLTDLNGSPNHITSTCRGL